MNIPKYSKGTKVRVIHPLKRYSPMDNIGRGFWEDKFPKIKKEFYWNIHDKVIEKECRVRDFTIHREKIVYWITSFDNHHALMTEEGIEMFKVAGHEFLGSLPEDFTNDKTYDVERWTPLRGGKYVHTIAVNVCKKEANEIFAEKQIEVEKNRRHMSGGYPSWVDNYRVVEHTPRHYHALKHEAQLGDIYCFKEELGAENMSLLIQAVEKEFDKNTPLYTKLDLDELRKKDRLELIEKIKNNLTTKTGCNDFDRVITKLKL